MSFAYHEEQNWIEYKSRLTEDFEKTVVAFLNSPEGGKAYIGIDEKTKSAINVINPDLTQRQVVDRIKNNIQPQTLGLFDVVLKKIEETVVIEVIVSSGTDKPYYLRKKGMSPEGCYIRVGSSNQPMPKNLIEDLFTSRLPLRIGNIPSPKKKLSFKQLEIYYQELNKNVGGEFLASLDLLNPSGQINYAGYLLADENNVSIKVAKYAGTDKVDLIENEEFGFTCLVTSAKRVLEKLRVENRTFAKITAEKRHERKMVDELALKEAVVNAFVHTDYSHDVPPVVELFSDRVAITSYGGLPKGLSYENFMRCRSMPRNRELMRVFKDLELVEQLGIGMSRILRAYDESVFTIEDNFLIVTFPYKNGFLNTICEVCGN